MSEASGRFPMAGDAERSILGAVLLENERWAEAQALSVWDFGLAPHRTIFRRMADLMGSGRAVDYITLRAKLDEHKELASVGGVAYLASLTENLPRRLSIAEYVRIVRDKAAKRNLIHACNEAIEAAADKGADAHAQIDALLGRIAKLQASGGDAASGRRLFVSAGEFLRDVQPQVDWAVEGLIQRGGNGLIVGEPGTAKSLAVFDLALHMVAGVPWMGRRIPRPMRVGIITREDHPSLSKRRALTLISGGDAALEDGLDQIDLNESLYFNSQQQSDELALTSERDVADIIAGLRAARMEFAVFDVFNRLWEGDENSNQEVTRVLAVLTRIARESGCAVALVHHLNKGEGGVFKRIRGAGAIHGWREWAFGITIENANDPRAQWVRRVEFETKADEAAAPLYFRIHGTPGKVALMQCDPPERPERAQGRKRRWARASGQLYPATNWQDRG